MKENKVNAAAGIEGLTRYGYISGAVDMYVDEIKDGPFVKFADVERLLGAHAPSAAKLTDERIKEHAVLACVDSTRMGNLIDFARAIEREVLGAHAGVTAEPAEPLTIALGQGLIEVGQGHHGDQRLPAILFGRNGAGAVGVETEGNRVMEPGECIAAVTFENYQSLDVVVEKLGELRMRIWPDAPHSQLSYGAAPHYRGYAHLGTGAYVLNHSAAGEPPELAISIATEAQKAGRVVGDMRDNEPGELVQPKDIAVRLRFENVAGLDALEQQLRFVRSEHFADAAPAAQAPVQNAEEVRAFLEEMTQCGKDMNGSYWIPRAAKLLAALASKEAAAAVAPVNRRLSDVLRGTQHSDDLRLKAASALGEKGAEA